MDLTCTGERCGCGGMTSITIRGRRSLQCVGSEGMAMDVVIKVTAMTGLTVTAIDTVQTAAYGTAVSCIMTSQTTVGRMDLTGSVKRGGGRGMTVNTERYRGYRSRMAVAMVIKVTCMTGLAVTAVDTVQTAAYGTSVGCIMTGQTTIGRMNLTGSVKRGGGRGMTACTESDRGYRSIVIMSMAVEVSSMTGQTGYSGMRCSTDAECCITPAIGTNDGGSGAAAGIVMTHRTGIGMDTGNDPGSRNAMTAGTQSVACEVGVRVSGMQDTAVCMTIEAANRSTGLDYILDP